MIKKIGFALTLIAGVNLNAQTEIKGFADVGFNANLDGEPSGFGMGQYDNYVTSRLSDKITMLGEVVFEYDQGWILDVERVIFKYEFNNFAYLEAGKFHTPLGFWNNEFHHGSLLEPTVTRPHAVKFEDEGGVLPIHTSGIQVAGENIGKYGFGYNLMIGNGIGSTPMEDNNTQKSITAGIKFEPVMGIIIGGSFFSDYLSSGTESLKGGQLANGLTQSIYNGYAVVRTGNLEFIGEYYHINNAADKDENNIQSNGFFTYLGYTFNKLTPYVLFDAVNFGKDDIYFAKNNIAMISPGLRYDLGLSAVLKVQYNLKDAEVGGKTNDLILSAAFGF